MTFLRTLGRMGAASLLLVACDSSPSGTDAGGMTGTDAGMMGTDAGMMMGTDAGMMMGTDAGPPDMNALMRQRAATARASTAACTCDMGSFASVAECASFNDVAELDACEDAAFSAQFAGVGAYFTCAAAAYETWATCYEGASCSFDSCDMAADSALTACESLIDETAGTAFGESIEMCAATNVIGSGGMCPDDSGAISTTGMSVFTGTTVAAANDLEPPAGCHAIDGGGGSPDRALRWTAPSDGAFVFDTIGSSFDTVLYLLPSCDMGATAIGCNDDIGDTDFRSRLTATLTSGQEVVVVVEGFGDTNAGTFVVNINPM